MDEKTENAVDAMIEYGVVENNARRLAEAHPPDEIMAVLAEAKKNGDAPGLLVWKIGKGEGKCALKRQTKREAKSRALKETRASDESRAQAAERARSTRDELRRRVMRWALNSVRTWCGRCTPETASQYRAGLALLRDVWGDDEAVAAGVPYPIEDIHPDTPDDEIFARMVEAARDEIARRGRS